jgi:aryl-alcohol dehydrogenase-like predicted oxidoreductase
VLPGAATAEGTGRYAGRVGASLPAGHFRPLAGRAASSLGLGTYLGREDDATDALYRRAVMRALERGVNVVDTAVNYRHQRSERAVGAAIADVVTGRALARDEILVSTKGGYIPFDGALPADPGRYFVETYVQSGIVKPDDVVGGSHCMTPRYLEDQIGRSRANLGLQTIDVYFLHNPESQLDEVERSEFMRRVRDAFGALEAAVAAGHIGCYGTATWNGYREPAGAPGFLSLEEMVAAARDVGGAGHHFKVIQLPYNLAMPEAFTRVNQPVGKETVSTLEAARRLGVYVMASASIYQGQLARNLPPLVAEYLPGLTTDAQRALQFVRSTPGIGTALVGMKSLPHVEENAAVARIAPMAWDDFGRLFASAG